MSKSQKKKKKKEALKKRRMMERAALGMDEVAIFDETAAQHGYFSVASMSKVIFCFYWLFFVFLFFII